MDDLRRFERMIAGCPEKTGSGADGLPPVSEEDFFDMETYLVNDPEHTHIFPYVRKSESGEWMIDIYVCDSCMYEEGYRRFVIREGYAFTEADEDSFFEYVGSKESVADADMMERVVEKVGEVFPEWHFCSYPLYRLKAAFAHLYYVAQKGGCREILYKAGLNIIADEIERIGEYDITGSSPEKIIGHNAPLKFLRIFNNEKLIRKLQDPDELSWNVDVYNAYSDHIIGTGLTPAQWAYFERLYDGCGLFGGKPFSRALFRRLGDTDCIYKLSYYEMFLHFREEREEFRRLRLPAAKDVDDVVDGMEEMLEYTRHDEKMDRRIQERWLNSDMEYRGREYSILMPRNSYDFFHEAMGQGNCVLSYAAAHSECRTTVLFLRKNDELKKPLVTMEVYGNHVEQVFGRFNRIPDIEVLVFLEEYCRKKKIYYDPEFIIRKCLGAEEDIEIEYEFEEEGIVTDHSMRALYSAYIKDFRKRMCWPSFCPEEDEKEYRQLEFEDCFPMVA